MSIFVRKDSLNETVSPSEFLNEDELERILTDCPELLCDDGSEATKSPRITLVDRQVVLPEAGKLDLLFVTRAGLPEAVEVELARNAQARREVIAQAVDYVSSLTALTVDELDERVEGRVEEPIGALTGDDDVEFDRLWRNVGTDLRAAKA